MGLTSITFDYIDDIPSFAVNCVFNLEVVVEVVVEVVPLEVVLIYGLVSRDLQVRQLLLHFLISGGALGAGRGSQRRLSSRSILW